MLNNMQNFFSTIANRLVKKKPKDTDLIAIGSKNDNYGGGYAPTAITYNDLKKDILSNIPAPECGTKFGLNWASVGPKVSFRKPDYQSGIRDLIIPENLEIARWDNQGIFNSIFEQGWDRDFSPQGTSWNSIYTDNVNYGWGNLGNIGDRTFDTFYKAVNGNIGCNIIGLELVLRHDHSGRMWIIKFTEWTQGGNGGGFAYDRWEIFPVTYFYRPPYSASIVDVVSDGLILKRDNIRGLYNAVLETHYDNQCDLSPLGTEWNSINTDPDNYGNKNLAQVRNRKFGTWIEAIDANPPGYVGEVLIMHDLSTDLYWFIVFLSWGVGDGGGHGEFELIRALIPQDCGIEFNDGTVMTTAATGAAIVCCYVDDDLNLVAADNSNGTVSVGPGGTHDIQYFSGMLIVNDHYDGGVETWIAGGGDTICLGATNTGGGPVGSSLFISGNGYTWQNDSNMNGPFTFTVIKTRDLA